ncbi:MAG: 50S ribosomal protein L10, partial [Clostridia bacterium]|nr:50S ribosomal protein L10 [Clostridia bacterium]
MPSNTILAQKQQIVADLAEQLKASSAGVLVNYQGITVDDDTKMRKALREAGVKYMVVKNSLTGRACE